ncbi:AnfO protein, required for Mo- and V-independent nitrogenase [Rhodovulum sp. PH10]|uniref:Fe-only nitrogenase accessory protein AnfO n=1 Tax=Rhodovulum sp. PH10 TaxID=1187851 RepID=UPI00027C222C|nr:Fe-only nitrogenase accessory protein AnfO [Rhodovulum sp. PH10]EJW10896.1 AnfO protein, required for Mo- and V-independent nitrogenase [Rhodovulum sp. PH10]
MKIAVHVDAEGEVAKISQPGAILVFAQSGATWTVHKTIRFAVGDARDLAAIHASLAAAVAEFEDCRVFLSRDVRGVVNSILQEMGIRTWQSHGSLFAQLDIVARRENERDQQEAAEQRAARKHERERGRHRRHHLDGVDSGAERTGPEPVGAPGSGHYRLDLVALLATAPDVNAWDILIPFLTGTPFRRLDVVCDEVPRWLARAVRALNMVAEVEPPARPGDTFTTLVVHRQQAVP